MGYQPRYASLGDSGLTTVERYIRHNIPRGTRARTTFTRSGESNQDHVDIGRWYRPPNATLSASCLSTGTRQHKQNSPPGTQARATVTRSRKTRPNHGDLGRVCRSRNATLFASGFITGARPKSSLFGVLASNTHALNVRVIQLALVDPIGPRPFCAPSINGKNKQRQSMYVLTQCTNLH